MKEKILRQLKRIRNEFITYPDFVESNLSYDDYWEKVIGKDFNKIGPFQRKRAEFVMKHTQATETLMDLGCGNGAVIREINKFRKPKIFAVDCSNYVLSKLSSENIETIFMDLNDKDIFSKLPKADHILLLEVLEHLPQPENFLRAALVHTDRSVFFSFPNTGYITHRIRLLLGKFPMQWVTHPGEHLRFWTLTDLKWWLKQLKFYERSTIHTYEGWPVLNKIWPSLFARSMIVRVTKV